MDLAKNLAEVDALLTLLRLKSRAVRRQDLNLPRSQILLRLLYASQHRVPQVELADTLQLAVSQVQKITEELQAQGFVKRDPGAPRGGYFVSLLPLGIQEAQALLQQRAKNEFSVLDRLLVEHTGDAKLLATVIEQLKAELAQKAA